MLDDNRRLNPEEMRRLLATGQVAPRVFRQALVSIGVNERDLWIDHVFDLQELANDGDDLPRGCVPYLPSSVSTLLRIADLASIRPDDVFVDVGCGLGRAVCFIHFLTGAKAVGIEVQAALARSASELVSRLHAEQHVSVVEGDVLERLASARVGTVFFFYCPFSGGRLGQVLEALRIIALERPIRVCSLDLPLPTCPWLAPVSVEGDVAVYKSAF